MKPLGYDQTPHACRPGGECPECNDSRPDRAQCPKCGYTVLWEDEDHAAEEWDEGCPRCETAWGSQRAGEVNR